MNYKEIIKKQSFIITASVIIMAIILTGTSFALFNYKNNSNTQVVSSGILVASYNGTVITTVGGSDSTEIEPISETTVDTEDPYIIKVKNNGTLAMKYNIIIYTSGSNTLPHSYYAIKYKNNGSYTTKAALTTFTKVDNNETNMNQIRYKLTTEPFIVQPGVEKTHEIHLWVDEDYADENISNKIANIKIVVEGEAINTNPVAAVSVISSLASVENSLVDDETTDHNIRYIGSNPNNYVQFNGELWRIIGVMNNIQTQGGIAQSLVKIKRAESLGNYSWDSSVDPNGNGGKGINQWGASGSYEGADLMRELNTDYLGNVTVGTNGKWYDGTDDSKSTDMPNSTISNDAQNMIESVVWNLGSPSNNNGTYDSNWADSSTGVTAATSYVRERANTNGKTCSSGDNCNDTVTRTSTWIGKVGLFYPSDYLYATAGGSTTSRSTCLGKPMYRWSDSSIVGEDCKNNDWLKLSSGWEWTLSPLAYSSHSYRVFYVLSDGYVGNGTANVTGGVAPVVFLKSSVKITGGEGTQDEPYTLSM